MTKILFIASLIVCFFPAAQACGPDGSSWYDGGPSLDYDPVNEAGPNPFWLYWQVFPRDNNYRRPETRYVVAEINDVSNANGRPLIDKKHKSINYSVYSWGYCASNNADTGLNFIKSVAANKNVSNEDYIRLVETRLLILLKCSNPEELAQSLNSYKEMKDPFSLYLVAISYFYLQDYTQAINTFRMIENDSIVWLAETSTYLIGRSYALLAQKDWNGWSKMEKIDALKINQSIAQFEQYLERFPNGIYATSAKGLQRRNFWLKQDLTTYTTMLTDAIAPMLLELGKKEQLNRTDLKSLMSLMIEYRRFSGDENSAKLLEIILTAVDVQLDDMSLNGELYVGLRRMRKTYELDKMFDAGEFTKIIGLLEKIEEKNTAENVLLARSLEAENRLDEANEVWVVIRDKVQIDQNRADLQIVHNLMSKEGLVGLYKSKLTVNPFLLRMVLANQCGVSEQTKVLSMLETGDKKHAVINDIAIRYLLSGDFKSLHDFFNTLTDEDLKEFSSIRTAVKNIATESDPGKGYINIAYFMNKVVGGAIGPESVDYLAMPQKEGCQRNVLTSKSHDPYFYYKKTLEYYTDKKSVSEQKALHYLVQCHRQGERSRSCIWVYENVARSPKKWFTRLHSRYKGSKWAKKTPVYYDN